MGFCAPTDPDPAAGPRTRRARKDEGVNIREAIGVVVQRRDLSQADAAAVMEEIMGGTATPAQIGAFLTALHCKGESDAEIAGMAAVMRAKATPVRVAGPVIDTCGTGGDGAQTFNISTTAAFVVAGAGLHVAKHGNRAMSSAAGSADVLEALGVVIDLEPEAVERCLHEAGICFMFAPRFHPAMRFAGPVRREIGIRTVFNVLGPLTNPAGARHQVLGVATPALAEKLAGALSRLDMVHALVVHGHRDGGTAAEQAAVTGLGMDELSLSGPNIIYEIRGDQPPHRQIIDAADLGLPRASVADLRGGTASENATITRAVVSGHEQGPKRDVVLLNAAAALVAGGAAPDMAAALALARSSIDHGHALNALQRLVTTSRTASDAASARDD